MTENKNRPTFLASEQLVFGIVALQNTFITREQLVAAFDAWVQYKSRGIADLLIAQGALTESHREILDRLVSLFLEKHGGNAEASLAALSSAAEVRPQLEHLGDADLAASLGHLGHEGGPDETVTMLRTSDGSRGRFRIVRPHAQGGLGQVSVAIDQELNREVALKEILPKHADNPSSRERFVLEAEITGGLEHPGIVPVYALGQAPDRRPFYAMRFIKGDSLKTAIEVYHTAGNPNRKDSGARQLELRQLLGRFIDVCNAIGYAHSRGVLHRDLKPGNIMVGKYGETLVVDWGLAKAVGRKEIDSDEASLQPTTALSSSGQTQPGSAVGTPAYMSPEQARGDLDHLGPQSDVYSLGATLYHVLCGRPPFEKGALEELLRKVEQGAFVRPTGVLPEVPRALEAICLKAMSRQPAERYPTAKALADDLEHWLADEPVAAYADTVSLKVARWSRKHRGLVQAGSVALVLLLVGAATAATIINEQRKQAARLAQEKGDLANEKAKLADTNRQLFESERRAKTLADERAANLKRVLALQAADHGVAEYAAGRISQSHGDLQRAVRLLADDPLRAPSLQILVDRVRHCGCLLAPPMWHEGKVWSVSFSPDGSRVVTGSEDKTARLWDGATGRPLGEPMRHEGAVWDVSFSPDGSRVVTGSEDKSARLWDGATGRPLGEPMRHAHYVLSVSFSSDGTRVVTGSTDNTARLWDGTTGRPLGEPMGHESAVLSVSFSPDYTLVVTGSYDGTARLWDVATGRPLGEPMRHEKEVDSVSFSSDGTRVLTGSLDSTARLWDGTTGRPLGEPMRHESTLLSASFSPDGSRVITGSWDKTARLWDGTTGRPLGEPMRHESAVLSASFSPDGTRVITGSDDNTARLWDGTTGRPLGEPMRHHEVVWSASFSPDGTRVVTGSTDHTARLWDGTTGRPLGEPMRHDDRVNSVSFSPDGTRVVTGSDDNTARLWDGTTNRPLGEPMRHQEVVWSASFSPDGTRVVTGSADNTARLWDGATGRPLGQPMRHEDYVLSVSFSPDGTRVITGSRDATARLWDGTTGRPLGELMWHGDGVKDVSFSPDGSRVVTGSSDATARLWDGTTGRPLGEPMRHGGGVKSVSFSPDGSRVITGGEDKTARLWDGATGRPLGEPMRHQDVVWSASFSPDGTRVVTGSDDNTARLWDGTTGRPLGEPMRHDDRVNSVSFSPDGTRVITGSTDATARLWDGTTGRSLGEPMRHAHYVLSASFSPDGSRVITGSWDKTARLWDVSYPDLKAIPSSSLDAVLTLWTGVQSDNEGNVRRLSREELDRIQASLGSNDWLSKFQSEAHARRVGPFHLGEAADAERTHNWFAAAFHLRELLKETPDDGSLKERLDRATKNLAEKQVAPSMP